MSERRDMALRRSIGRLMPSSLAGRLFIAIVALTAVVSLTTVAIDSAIVRYMIGQGRVPAEFFFLGNASTLIASLVAAGVGAGLGLWLARAGRTPVERLIGDIETAGDRVLESGEHAEPLVTAEPDLPEEFNRLASAVDRVLHGLAARQGELSESVAEARSAKEALETVVAGSVDPQVLLVGETIELANPAAALAFSVPAESLRGSNIMDALAGITMLDESGVELDPATVFQKASRGPFLIHVERERGGPASFEVCATVPAPDDPARVLFTARHMTEELRVQRIRSEIVEIVSHDLRAPLAVVSGYLDVLGRPLSDDDRARVIEAAKRDAVRMGDLLDDLLSAAKAEELLAPSELRPCSLADIAGEVVASMGAAHPGRQLLVDAAGSSRVLGDEKRLREMLVNLVVNALRYSPDETSVTVRVSDTDSKVDLEVVDHGPGIPEGQRKVVFERYARLDRRSGPRSGLGLGLYIVRIIAESHGGCARVDETPGGGATFVIELPAAAPDAV